MNNFDKLKSLDIDKLAEWLDENGQYDTAPWSLWFDKQYCKNCEDIICKSPDDSRQYRCAYCEIYDKCKFFPEIDDVPNSKDVIKMWLEAEVEDEEV
jgi:hypothetical protein